MATELAVINEQELEAFAAATGASSEDLQGGSNFLPQLKVNYDEENPETKKELKKGLFFLTGQDVTVYAKNVVIRPLLQHFQWTEYSKAEEKTVNRTKFIVNLFKDEPRDEKGTIRCGKPPSKELRGNPDLAEKYENINCYRTIHAFVSYEGEDEDGNKHTVENVLAVLRLKGANFSGFHDEYIANLPKGTKLWDYQVTLGTTREKNGATYYYVIHFDADYTKKIPLDSETFETLKGIQSTIDAINKDIDEKYFNAHSNSTADADAISALQEVSSSRPGAARFSLDNDLEEKDDIPF